MKAIKDYQATVLYLVPPISESHNFEYSREILEFTNYYYYKLHCSPAVLYLAGNDSVKAEDLASVRNIMSGAAPLGAMDIERLRKK